MEGLIQEGDLLDVQLFEKPISIEACIEGDIVVKKSANGWLVHRVVKSESITATKGDQSLVFDSSAYDLAWGKVESLKSKKGFLAWPFQSRNFSYLAAYLSGNVHSNKARFIRGAHRRFLLVLTRMTRFLFTKSESSLIFSQSTEKLFEIAPFHKLDAYFYSKLSDQDKALAHHWKQIRIEEALKNKVILDNLKEWQRELPEDMRPVILKGASLLGRVYEELGDRQMSDLDLLATASEKSYLEGFLQDKGFSKMTEDHGSAHACKSMWLRDMWGSQFVVEIHEKLFWYQSENFKWNVTDSLLEGYDQLDLEDEIIYLSIHLSYSHNFQRLFWLLDIYKLLEKYEDQVDWQKLRKRTEQLKAEKAVAACLIAIEKIFGYEVMAWPFKNKYWSLRLLLRPKFLYNPYGSISYYLFMKHVLQDSLWNAIKSDFLRLKLEIQRIIERTTAHKHI